MAQPYEKNGRWYFRYRDAEGAWRDKATSARTKTEARRLQLELERRIERQRLGLEPLPSDTPELTFAEAADLWWSEHGRRLRSHTIRRFMQKHLEAEVGPLPLSQVGERLESVLNAKVGTLGPESLNHLRAAVHRVFAFLTRRGRLEGRQPGLHGPPVQGPEAPPPLPPAGRGPAPPRGAGRALAWPLRDCRVPRAPPRRGHRSPQIRR